MKKFFVAAVCVLCATAMSAQRTGSFFSTDRPEKMVTLGVRAGYNLSNQVAKYKGESESADALSGYHAGLSADIAFMESFGLNTGLFFTSKGYKSEIYGQTLKVAPLYLEIPVLASYRYGISDNVRLDVDFGPYFAVGVAGKMKMKSVSEKVFGKDGMKRFDCGLKVGAGVTFSKIYVGLHYGFGLANLGEGSDITQRNRSLNLSVGYNF